MSSGFIPTPEKECVQNVLWIPVIRELFKRREKRPLSVICLPGRECRFLVDLLKRKYTNLENITCIEKSPVEALLIRSRLAEYDKSGGRPRIDVVTKTVYEFFTQDDPVDRKYDVVDLDIYGSLDEAKKRLLNSMAAVMQVQVRANMKDWLLLLTTEVASARGDVRANLATAMAVLERAYTDDITNTLPEATDAESTLRRYAAFAFACVVDSAAPGFDAKLERAPMFYRGADVYGRPGQRALMGTFPVRLTLPKHAVGALGESERREQRQPLVSAGVRKALRPKAAILDPDEDVARVSKDLSELNFD